MHSRIPFTLAALLIAWTAFAAPSDRDFDLEIPLKNWLPALNERVRQDHHR